MRTELDHLPLAKRRELDRVVQILFEEFDDAHGKPDGQRKLGRILKVILYGSYARGNWVDEPHTAKAYQSDFDLLVIVNQKELTDRVAYWEKADERLNRERTITQNLKTPVNFIVHSLQEVNDGLAHGRSFFIDVARDGIALYQAEDSELHQPKPKTPDEAFTAASEYFEEWFSAALSAQKGFHFYMSQKEYRDAAFTLHQASERLYHCILLVTTFYTPHVHNLAFLRTQAERQIQSPFRGLAPRQCPSQSAFCKTQGRLRKGALLKALSDHRGRADLALRTRRGAWPPRPRGLHGTNR
jgi:predicted nucleotidyltransferase